MKSLNILISFLILVFLLSPGVLAVYQIDKISYSIWGDFDEIKSIELKVEDNIDYVNSLAATLSNDGDSFKLDGDWKLNFLKRSTYKMNFNLLLPLDLDGFDLGKGIGLSGESFYNSTNRFYWDLAYFFDKDDDRWVYEGGLLCPVAQKISLKIGLGNTYWDTDNSLHIGFEVDI